MSKGSLGSSKLKFLHFFVFGGTIPAGFTESGSEAMVPSEKTFMESVEKKKIYENLDLYTLLYVHILPVTNLSCKIHGRSRSIIRSN
jgi:hypothetical protein